MPYHTLHSWVRDKRRALRKTIVKAPPKTMVDAQARVRDTRPRQWKSEVLSSTPSAAAVLSISSWIQFGFSLNSIWTASSARCLSQKSS